MRKFIRKWLGIDDMADFQAQVIKDLKSDVMKLIEHMDTVEMHIEHIRFLIKDIKLPPADLNDIRGQSHE